MKTFEQLADAAVLLLALADVFLTILYARMYSGLLAMRYAHGIERSWVWNLAGLRPVARELPLVLWACDPARCARSLDAPSSYSGARSCCILRWGTQCARWTWPPEPIS